MVRVSSGFQKVMKRRSLPQRYVVRNICTEGNTCMSLVAAPMQLRHPLLHSPLFVVSSESSWAWLIWCIHTTVRSSTTRMERRTFFFLSELFDLEYWLDDSLVSFRCKNIHLADVYVQISKTQQTINLSSSARFFFQAKRLPVRNCWSLSFLRWGGRMWRTNIGDLVQCAVK